MTYYTRQGQRSIDSKERVEKDGRTDTRPFQYAYTLITHITCMWLGSGVVSVLDLGAEGPRFKSQSQCCRVTVLGKLFTPIVSLFIKQQHW